MSEPKIVPRWDPMHIPPDTFAPSRYRQLIDEALWHSIQPGSVLPESMPDTPPVFTFDGLDRLMRR